MLSRRLYALFGLLATLTGMAVGHLSASLLNPDSSPVLAVGSTVIDATPVSVKEWAIKAFETENGNLDKVVLVGSVMAGALVLAMIGGILTRRSFRLGVGVLLALVAAATLAALTRPNAEMLDAVPGILTAITGAAALWWLDRTARGLPIDPRAKSTVEVAKAEAEVAAASGASETPPTRRTILIGMGALAGAAAVFGGAGKWIGSLRARPEDIALPAPAAGEAAGALPVGLEKTVPGITPLQISNANFYRVDTRLDTPVVSSNGWTLTVDGDVENKLSISFDELLEMPMVERDITLTCVSNSVGGKYVGGARWLGVPLKDILDRAGVGTTADQILQTDFDGMTISTPLDLATDGRDALLAVGMNGVQLPREHGFPVRMVIPGLYGFISATKWLTKLTLTTYADQEAYWTRKTWATDAPIKPSARIDTLKALQEIPAGKENLLGGVAWAQNDGGVDTVQIQIDGGAWTDAMLGPDVGNVYWRQWYLPWTPKAGTHTIKARATTNDGTTQTDVRAEPFPEGSSGIHTLFITAS
ncbi:MAG: molybdopterin-dependent oxidoreductase [Nocardioides sp.]